MKTLIATFVSLLLGVAIGWYFEHRHAERKMTDVVEQMEQPIEAADCLEATRDIRAIELIQSGNTQQAVQVLSFPITDFYKEYANLKHTEVRTKNVLAQIEFLARTNQAVAAQIKYDETNAGIR